MDEPTDSNIQDDNVELDERDREADDEESISRRSDVEPTEEQVPDSDEAHERTTTEQDPRGSATASEQVDEQKKSLELQEESNDLESWNKWVAAAEEEVAKENNIPDTNNRVFYPEELDNQEYIMKEKGKQVVKETKPDSDTTTTKDSYIQNEEQNDSSLWKRLKK